MGAWAVGGTLVVAGCSGGSAPSASSETVAAASAPQTTDSAYAFFEATSFAGEYLVTAVNGVSFTCGRNLAATSCLVSTVDLSALNVAPEVVTALMAQITSDPDAPQLLFAGAVTGGALVVQEVWRSPAPARLSGTLLQVSHTPERALVVNRWTPTPIGQLDFSKAPLAQDCETETDAGGTECAPSLAPAETDVATPAGVLLEGWTRGDGTLHVQRYFLDVTVGLDDLGDGYSYCQEGQTLCPNGQCSDSVCKNGHGGHGMIAIYQRSDLASFDAWLVATGQLLSTDTP
jgi:hypothetical protein